MASEEKFTRTRLEDLEERIDAVEQEVNTEETEERDEKIVETIEKDLVEIVEVTESVPSVFLQNAPLILLVVGAGIALIMIRFIVMLAAPAIASKAKLYTRVIDDTFGGIQIIFRLFIASKAITAAGFLLDSENEFDPFEAVNVLATIVTPYLLGIAKFSKTFTGVNFKALKTDDVQAFFTKLPEECSQFDNIETVFLFPVKMLASDTICPIIRVSCVCLARPTIEFPRPAARVHEKGLRTYALTNVCPQVTWPVDWLYSVSTFFLGWMSFDADPTGNNCQKPDDLGFAWVCTGLGMGYIVIDVIFPLLLFMLFGYKYVFPVLSIIYHALEFILEDTVTIVEKVERTLSDVVNDLGQV